MYHVAVLMRLLFPHLQNRDKKLMEEGRGSIKSGIIVTSSIAPQFSVGASTQYSSSKVFCDFLGEAISYELDKSSSRVEITTLCPGPVDTTMAASFKGSCLMVTPQKCVYKALKDLGREVQSNGAMSHEILAYLGRVIMLHWCTLGFRSQ